MEGTKVGGSEERGGDVVGEKEGMTREDRRDRREGKRGEKLNGKKGQKEEIHDER